jgi:predicted DNA-binding transcriptional regulator AlpA
MPTDSPVLGPLTPDTLLMPEDLETLLRVDRRTIRRWVAQSLFPRPIRPGGHRIRWRATDVRRYLETLDASSSNTAPPPND